MAKSSTTKSAKKRVEVKDLPAAKKKTSTKEMKKVKGGGEVQTITVTGSSGSFKQSGRK